MRGVWLLLLCASCAHYTLPLRLEARTKSCWPVMIVVPLDQPAYLVSGAKRAIDFWNAVRPGMLVWGGVADVDSLQVHTGFVTVTEGTMRTGLYALYRHNKRVGCTHGGRVIISPPDRGVHPLVYIDNTIRHELGHAIGLDHIGERGYLMSFVWSREHATMVDLPLSEKTKGILR